MAEREAGKARKRAVKTRVSVRPAPMATPVGPRPSRGKSTDVRALEAERDQLRAELEAARARIAELERVREQVLNRIDWVIDSLHSLGDE
jgi:uncharacterized coiled-coil DUF342 family protein